MTRFPGDLLTDETGQDLVEYALLASVIGLACIAVFNVLLTALSNAYGSWESGTDNLWETPNPSGS